MDLILRGSSGNLIIKEIKYSSNAALSKGFYSAAEDLQLIAQYIIVLEGNLLQRSATIKVCGLFRFLRQVMPVP